MSLSNFLARRSAVRFFLFALILAWVLAGCGSSPTSTPEQVVVSPTIRMLDLSVVATAPPTDIPPPPTPYPTPTRLAVTVTPPSLASPAATSCLNQAEFVKSLSIGDNTQIKPGFYFTKIWQVKNAGTCTWTAAYRLVFLGGEAMIDQQSFPLPAEVRPGETVDLRLDLVAPETPNLYSGQWMLSDENGALFGFGPQADQPLIVQIVVPKSVVATPC